MAADVSRRVLRALSRWHPKKGPWVVTGVEFRSGWGESTVVSVSVAAEGFTQDAFDRVSHDELKAMVRDALPGERLIVEVLGPG